MRWDPESRAVVRWALPPQRAHPKGERPWLPDRPALCGILYVPKTGLQWRMLPQELGCGTRCTASCSTASARAGAARPSTAPACGPQGGGQATGPNPTDRAKPGTKHHLVVDRHGLPLACGLTGANRPDATVFEALVASLPALAQPNGRRRKRPLKLHADKGYDVSRCRCFLHQRGIKVRIARKGVENPAQLGRFRWVVERSFAWLNAFRRLAPATPL